MTIADEPSILYGFAKNCKPSAPEKSAGLPAGTIPDATQASANTASATDPYNAPKINKIQEEQLTLFAKWLWFCPDL